MSGVVEGWLWPRMLYGWIVEWMKRGMQESGTELAKMFEEAQGTGIKQ